MYGLLITVTGWTWEYIDECMTLPRLEELRIYWADSPPIHLAFIAFARAWSGEGSSKRSEVPVDQQANLEMLAQLFPIDLEKKVSHGNR